MLMTVNWPRSTLVQKGLQFMKTEIYVGQWKHKNTFFVLLPWKINVTNFFFFYIDWKAAETILLQLKNHFLISECHCFAACAFTPIDDLAKLTTARVNVLYVVELMFNATSNICFPSAPLAELIADISDVSVDE